MTFSQSQQSAYFTCFANSAPALNFATFFAAIFIALPVWGLRPILAALLATEKLPNPTNATLSPFFRDLVIALVVASNAFPASTLVNYASLAIASINWALFIFFILLVNNCCKDIDNIDV